MRHLIYSAVAAMLLSVTVSAHDIWLEPSRPTLRPAELIYLNVLIGNHGNHHRDFKIASKVDTAATSLSVARPDGTVADLSDQLIDRGLTAKDGYHVLPYRSPAPGLHTIVARFDKVMHYAPIRAIHCAKTRFLITESLDDPTGQPLVDRVVGAPLELILDGDDVLPIAGHALRLQLLANGKPLAGQDVTFIPLGATLQGERDAEHQIRSDAQGRVQWTPTRDGLLLISAHHADPDAKGDGYDSSKYVATYTLWIAAAPTDTAD